MKSKYGPRFMERNFVLMCTEGTVGDGYGEYISDISTRVNIVKLQLSFRGELWDGWPRRKMKA